MLGNLLTVSTQVAILFVIMGIGLLGDKLGFFTEKAARLVTDLLFTIVMPAAIINAFMGIGFSRDKLAGFFIAAACGAATHVLGILLSLLFFRRSSDSQRAVLRFSVIFSNCGFLGLPIAKALTGDEGMFYCSVFIVVFNIFTFTYGIFIMSGDKKDISPLKLLINPGTVGVMLGMPLFLFSVPLPAVVLEPIHYMASLNTPLAMLILGTYLAKTNFKAMLRDTRMLIACALRMIVIPTALFGIFYFAGMRGTLLVACMIPACAPIAGNAVIFSAKFGRDVKLGSQLVAISTLLSILTMSFILAAAMAA